MFVKEKVIVCANIIIRKLKQKKYDERLDRMKGDKICQGFHLTFHEHSFILRGSYPASYLKFIKKEEWFIKMKNKVKKYF